MYLHDVVTLLFLLAIPISLALAASISLTLAATGQASRAALVPVRAHSRRR
jgi:hypothetical protein